MSECTPTTEEIREAFASRFWDDYSVYQPTEEDLGEERANFDRWFAEELRKAKAEAWEHVGRELRAIPHWWNTEDQHGEFDLQPLGPDKTSEQGAFMHVKQIMDNNPYRQGENK